MEGTSSRRLPPGFRVGTVAARTLRHVVPPDGRFGICGAPVAQETLVAHVADDDLVCTHCIDRLTGRKPFVPQPPAKKPKPPAPPPPEPLPAPEPVPEPRTVKIELPRRIAKLLDGVLDLLDPVESQTTSRREPLRYELLVAEAEVVAEVLKEMGETRESTRIVRAVTLASSSPRQPQPG